MSRLDEIEKRLRDAGIKSSVLTWDEEQWVVALLRKCEAPLRHCEEYHGDVQGGAILREIEGRQ